MHKLISRILGRDLDFPRDLITQIKLYELLKKNN